MPLLLFSYPVAISENVVGFVMDPNRHVMVDENSTAEDREFCVVVYSLDEGAGPFTVDVVYVPRTARGINITLELTTRAVLLHCMAKITS